MTRRLFKLILPLVAVSFALPAVASAAPRAQRKAEERVRVQAAKRYTSQVGGTSTFSRGQCWEASRRTYVCSWVVSGAKKIGGYATATRPKRGQPKVTLGQPGMPPATAIPVTFAIAKAAADAAVRTAVTNDFGSSDLARCVAFDGLLNSKTMDCTWDTGLEKGQVKVQASALGEMSTEVTKYGRNVQLGEINDALKGIVSEQLADVPRGLIGASCDPDLTAPIRGQTFDCTYFAPGVRGTATMTVPVEDKPLLITVTGQEPVSYTLPAQPSVGGYATVGTTYGVWIPGIFVGGIYIPGIYIPG